MPRQRFVNAHVSLQKRQEEERSEAERGGRQILIRYAWQEPKHSGLVLEPIKYISHLHYRGCALEHIHCSNTMVMNWEVATSYLRAHGADGSIGRYSTHHRAGHSQAPC